MSDISETIRWAIYNSDVGGIEGPIWRAIGVAARHEARKSLVWPTQRSEANVGDEMEELIWESVRAPVYVFLNTKR